MLNSFLNIGKVINKRGIAGELKVECYCDSTSSIDGTKVLYTDKNGKVPHDVITVKNYKGYLYIRLSDVDSSEKADKMRGVLLYANRNDIKNRGTRNFIADMLGLEVRDADSGKVYGKLAEVFNTGASDIYRVVDAKDEYFVPAVPEIVINVDINDCILIRPIPGIFDKAEEIR